MNNHDDFPIQFGDLSTVNAAWLTLTNFCNVHCSYCFNYVYEDHEFMSTDLVTKVIKDHADSLDKNQSKSLNISYFGGEPTANHKGLLAALDAVEKTGLPNHQLLFTNGFMNDKVLQSLIGRGLNFQVSFDGFHQNLRLFKNGQEGLTVKTVEFIEALYRAGENVTIRATIHEANAPFMADLVTYCERFPGINLAFAPICQFGDVLKFKIKQSKPEDYMHYLLNALEQAESANVTIEKRGKHHFEHIFKHKRVAPFVWLPDGKVAMTITYASSSTPGADTIIIGEYNHELEKTVLDDPKIEKMKQNYHKNVDRYCHDCSISDLCRGTIHFTPFATDTFVPERDYYFCEIARKSYQILD